MLDGARSITTAFWAGSFPGPFPYIHPSTHWVPWWNALHSSPITSPQVYSSTEMWHTALCILHTSLTQNPWLPEDQVTWLQQLQIPNLTTLSYHSQLSISPIQASIHWSLTFPSLQLKVPQLRFVMSFCQHSWLPFPVNFPTIRYRLTLSSGLTWFRKQWQNKGCSRKFMVSNHNWALDTLSFLYVLRIFPKC